MGRTPAGQTRERVFRFVAARLTRGEPPTIREVQERFGFRAVQTAREHLERLVAEGRLVKEPGRARGYRLPDRGVLSTRDRATLVPVLGNVQAGAPTTAVEDLEGYVPMHRPISTGSSTGSQSESNEWFGLRVRGESMRDAGILPGDVVIVRRQDTAQTGDIVVALWQDEATVKTFRRIPRARSSSGQARIELHPANPDFDPILVDAGSSDSDESSGDSWCLLGKVVEVRRFLEGAPFGA